MAKKKQFVLRITPEKYRALEKWAEDEFRSTNGQIEWIITQALKAHGRWKKDDDNNNTKTHDKDEKT